MGKKKKRLNPRRNVSKLLELVEESKNIFKDLLCEECKEKGVKVSLSNKKTLNYPIFCLDKKEEYHKRHRCDCIIIGVHKPSKNKIRLFIAIIELKSGNLPFNHVIDQINACCDIINSENQEFCSKFMSKADFIPIVVYNKNTNRFIYNMLKNNPITFHSKKQRIITQKNPLDFDKLLKNVYQKF